MRPSSLISTVPFALGAMAALVAPVSGQDIASANALVERGMDAHFRLRCAAYHVILANICQHTVPAAYYSTCTPIAEAYYSSCLDRASNDIPNMDKVRREPNAPGSSAGSDDCGPGCKGQGQRCFDDCVEVYGPHDGGAVSCFDSCADAVALCCDTD
ncbi:hypothetical protein TI39_contig5833g00001 [Zymoseptoria brevis]|uniref:Uncharacterized protein n=1 Tax=Zymoseptoria brevis TaxID=1047168 RepID=A0A0F4G5J8_9PEZI|nr:hypothetical protein TI39_contig5833g00001 [Zymoseptoria brevis]